jgi:hypothetical protein
MAHLFAVSSFKTPMTFSRIHGVTPQKILVLTVTAVRVSDPIRLLHRIYTSFMLYVSLMTACISEINYFVQIQVHININSYIILLVPATNIHKFPVYVPIIWRCFILKSLKTF